MTIEIHSLKYNLYYTNIYEVPKFRKQFAVLLPKNYRESNGFAITIEFHCRVRAKAKSRE